MQRYIEMLNSVELPKHPLSSGPDRPLSPAEQRENYDLAHTLLTTLKQDYPEYREYEAFDPGVSEEELDAELEEELGDTERLDTEGLE